MNGGSACNSTFYGNTANFGGGMHYANASNCTFISNIAKTYGGAMNGGFATQSIFYFNEAEHGGAISSLSTSAMAIGFIAAFVSGCFACKWMISIVKKCKLIYFGVYCAIAGTLVLIFG